MLFGAAVLLIIGAALFVPWRRMQQLTSQLNEKAASAVARYVVADHVVSAERPAGLQETKRRPLVIEGQTFAAPRIVGAKSDETTRFERSSITHFVRDPDKTFNASDYQLADGSWGYRYAQALYARQECLSCHGSALAQAAQQ